LKLSKQKLSKARRTEKVFPLPPKTKFRKLTGLATTSPKAKVRRVRKLIEFIIN